MIGYNCKGAINSGKIRGAGSSTFTGEQQLEQFYCTCASEIARRKCEENVVSDLSVIYLCSTI